MILNSVRIDTIAGELTKLGRVIEGRITVTLGELWAENFTLPHRYYHVAAGFNNLPEDFDEINDLIEWAANVTDDGKPIYRIYQTQAEDFEDDGLWVAGSESEIIAELKKIHTICQQIIHEHCEQEEHGK